MYWLDVKISTQSVRITRYAPIAREEKQMFAALPGESIDQAALLRIRFQRDVNQSWIMLTAVF